jgi:hypothetical protein
VASDGSSYRASRNRCTGIAFCCASEHDPRCAWGCELPSSRACCARSRSLHAVHWRCAVQKEFTSGGTEIRRPRWPPCCSSDCSYCRRHIRAKIVQSGPLHEGRNPDRGRRDRYGFSQIVSCLLLRRHRHRQPPEALRDRHRRRCHCSLSPRASADVSTLEASKVVARIVVTRFIASFLLVSEGSAMNGASELQAHRALRMSER